MTGVLVTGALPHGRGLAVRESDLAVVVTPDPPAVPPVVLPADLPADLPTDLPTDLPGDPPDHAVRRLPAPEPRALPVPPADSRLVLAEQTLVACLGEPAGRARQVRASTARMLLRQYVETDPAEVTDRGGAAGVSARVRLARHVADLVAREATGRPMPLGLVLAGPADVRACVASGQADDRLSVLTAGFAELAVRQLRRHDGRTATGRALLQTVGARLATLDAGSAAAVESSVQELLAGWRVRYPQDATIVEAILGARRTVLAARNPWFLPRRAVPEDAPPAR